MQTLDEVGEGRVIVVNGQASKRCALLGDLLAGKLHRNGFAVCFLLLNVAMLNPMQIACTNVSGKQERCVTLPM